MSTTKRRTADYKDFTLAANATARPDGLAGVLRALRYKGFTISSEKARSMWAVYLRDLPNNLPANTDAGPAPELPLFGGTMSSPAERRQVLSGRRTFVLTCAQNNTELMPDHWWKALLNLVHTYEAELHISQFTYNKSAYGQNSVKPGTQKASDTDDLWYDPRIVPYISNEDIQLAPDLVWLGSVNLIPTLVNPISGFQNHTRDASCVLPHTKIALESVPTMKNERTKFIYTTGCVTQRNYIQKSAGQKADFHHVFGALLVEVDEHGDWWARQLNFDTDGVLYDLTNKFTADEVQGNQRVQAVTHGDIHGWKLDTDVSDTVFGVGALLDALEPREQFFHDIVDFMPRNHHNIKDFRFLAAMHNIDKSSVLAEFEYIADWLMNKAFRWWCSSYVVVSNHDQAVNTWLSNRSALDDPYNVELWLHLNLKQIRDKDFHPFRELLLRACDDAAPQRPSPTVIAEDDSYRILGQIEAGLHGHLGPNGARGAPRNLRTAGKANTGHTHSAGIVEGIYTAGVLGKLDMGYNKGLSSWSHSSIVTYPNGKRTIITLRNGKWWRE